MSRKILIVGGVAGGATAAARLRRLNESDQIIMFERDEYISFANCGLPYYIGEVIKDRKKLIVQSKKGMSSRFNLDIRNFSEVVEIDRTNKEVVVLNRETNEKYHESYDKLILSPGAKPIFPNINGIDEATNLFTLRNIPDTDKIYNHISDNEIKHASVIGGGYIGIEMAENLRHRGINVTLIERANQVMASADFEMAQMIHQEMTNNGVSLVLGDEVVKIENKGRKITTKSGFSIETDMVIMAIGVQPETKLAVDCGLEIGETKAIKVNENLITSDPNIYACGDAIEVEHFVTKQPSRIPLAWPANRQGRLIADHINGLDVKYKGTLGAGVIKVFDKTFASVGANEKQLQQAGIEYEAIHADRNNHAGYYPGATPIHFKVIFSKEDGTIYGAQAIGEDGVEKRIDVISTSIQGGLKIFDLEDIELCYAPPFGSAKDPVNICGYIGTNVYLDVYKNLQWHEVDEIVEEGGFLLDVRTEGEYELGHIKGSVNITLDSLRDNLNQIPKDQPIYITCQVGHRGYLAVQILKGYGFTDIYNLTGGYKLYANAKKCVQANKECDIEKRNIEPPKKDDIQPTISIEVDACGLQCPGPILETKKAIDGIKDGEVIKVSASDPGYSIDVETWCEQTNNTLLSVEKEGKSYVAHIKKGTEFVIKDENCCTDKENATIVLFSGELDKALAAMIIAQGAASMGKQVSIFTTFWGLNALRKTPAPKVTKPAIEAMFGAMMPTGAKNLPLSNMNFSGMGKAMMEKVMKSKNVDPIDVQIQRAMDMGVKFIACTMSMDVMGITEEELIDGIELGGVAAYIGDAAKSSITLFI